MTAPSLPPRAPAAPLAAHPHQELHEAISLWFSAAKRDLPWRDPQTSAWGVLVSEVMLQQTPVARVAPAWDAWMRAWPTPADLAAASPADVLRAWNRLGYPRRALRLRECAAAIVAEHGGEVPASLPLLLALPGVGEYTAAAVLTFAFGQRIVVLDTNVRRVLDRLVAGQALPAPSPNGAERQRAAALLPLNPPDAARWNIGVMELGALVCTAKNPDCGSCPVAQFCQWRAADYPADEHAARRRAQAWEGTDRQARGRVLAALRRSDEPVAADEIANLWPEAAQLARAVGSLLADGLIEPADDDGALRLPR